MISNLWCSVLVRHWCCFQRVGRKPGFARDHFDVARLNLLRDMVTWIGPYREEPHMRAKASLTFVNSCWGPSIFSVLRNLIPHGLCWAWIPTQVDVQRTPFWRTASLYAREAWSLCNAAWITLIYKGAFHDKKDAQKPLQIQRKGEEEKKRGNKGNFGKQKPIEISLKPSIKRNKGNKPFYLVKVRFKYFPSNKFPNLVWIWIFFHFPKLKKNYKQHPK